MIDPELGNFGKESVEAGMGYAPMEPAYPVEKDETPAPEPSGQDHLDPRQAAEEILLRRANGDAERAQQELERESRPLDSVRQYYDAATGKALDDKLTVEAQQAASDLARNRRSEAEAAQAALDQQVAERIDQIRAEPEPQQAQPQEVPPVEQQPQAAGDDEVARALQNPRVLEAVQAHVAQAEAQSAAISNYYVQAVQQNALAATASLVAQFPELHNLTPEQIPIAIQTVHKTNPQRAAEMVQHIEITKQIIAEHNRAQQAQVAAYQQQSRQAWAQHAKAADDAYEKWAGSQFTGEQNAEMAKEAFAMLREYGASEQEIAQAWNTNAAFRSYPAQRMMADAARYRMIQRSLASKKVINVPTVQRPGSPLERTPDADYRLDKLRAKLDATGSPKDAAAYLTARRAARR